jgi:3-polyprenyl-4-hydroxybenzoate decarboxylase
MKRIIVGISGASGVIYGIRLLEMLKDIDDVESHLVMTNGSQTQYHTRERFEPKR